MADNIHTQSFFTRSKYYGKISDVGLDARNYNIQAQRVLQALEREPSKFLRWHTYMMFQTTMFVKPKLLKEETVIAFINLLAKEPNILLRGMEFNTLMMRYNGISHMCLGDQMRTPAIKEAFKAALHVEKEGLKPFAQGSQSMRRRNVIVYYLEKIIDILERGEQRKQMKPRTQRDRSGPSKS